MTDQAAHDQPAGRLLTEADQLARERHWGDAAAVYQEALDAGADPARAWYGLGVSRMGLREAAGARAALGQAIAADPGQPNAYFQLGFLAEVLESDPARAAVMYRQTLGMAPGHSGARSRLQGLGLDPPEAPSTGPVFAGPVAAGPMTAGPMTAGPVTAGRTQDSGQPPAAFRPLAADLDPNTDPGTLSDGLHGPLVDDHHRPVLRGYLPWLLAPALAWGIAAALTVAAEQVPPSLSRWLSLVAAVAESLWPPLLLFVVGLALLRRWTTTFDLYERRVDLLRGILLRRQTTVWLHEVNHTPLFSQTLAQTLTGTGTIALPSDSLPPRTSVWRPGRATVGQLEIANLAGPGRLLQLTEELRTRVLQERRALLNQFIAR